MGSRGKIEPSNIKMRAVLMSLAGLLLVAPQTEGTMKLMEKMVGEINTHRLKSDCFGEVNKKNYDLAIEGAMEKCMQLAPAFNLLNMLPTSDYQDCYDISESIPQTALNKHPLKKMFGRQMMFFKCAEKNDRMNCALGQMKQWLESHYSDSRDMSEYGLPEDQYEAAGLTLMVKYSAASDEEKFLSNFFWGAKW